MTFRRIAAAGCLLAVGSDVCANIYEMPRSTAATPVQVLVTCAAPICRVAEHCDRYDQWDSIIDADFRNEWDMEKNQAIMTPKRASASLLCAISVREGSVYFRPLRFLRVRDEDNNWQYVSMARDRGWPEMGAAEAPATEYDFHELVKGQGCA